MGYLKLTFNLTAQNYYVWKVSAVLWQVENFRGLRDLTNVQLGFRENSNKKVLNDQSDESSTPNDDKQKYPRRSRRGRKSININYLWWRITTPSKALACDAHQLSMDESYKPHGSTALKIMFKSYKSKRRNCGTNLSKNSRHYVAKLLHYRRATFFNVGCIIMVFYTHEVVYE